MNRIPEILQHRLTKLLMIVAVVSWVAWLRGPSVSVPMWNVDETIHATVAEVLLEGGTLYRDAIDQRTPLTYYVTAAVFAVSDSSLTALRILILLMIAAVAVILGRTALRVNGPYTGYGAAVIFAALSSFLLLPEDTFSAHTEWFVVFFTAAAAWCFLTGEDRIPTTRRCALGGAFLGLAIMSKQSALLDTAPAMLALVVVVADRNLSWQDAARRAGVLLGSILAMVLLVSAPVFLNGAGADYLYFTWTYNLDIYGAEFTFAEKIWSGARLLEALAEEYPILLLTGGISLVWLLARCLQFNPPDSARARRFGEVYLFTWLVTSTGAAMAGGRGFDHYFFPVLAPLAWVCAMGPAFWFRQLVETTVSNRITWALTWVTLLGVSYAVIFTPLKARQVSPPGPDAALRLAAWIKEQTTAEDRIFVWGFNPDIYRYTDRLPASRFVYCTFQTGLIPWTNIDPDIDTSYAIVQGAMDTLLEDLRANRPRFFVDSSAGLHRHFGKYPLRLFPPLNDWLNQNYVEIDNQRWGHQGFRLYIRGDEPVEELTNFDPARLEYELKIFGNDRIAPGRNRFGVGLTNTTENSLTGLGLSVNDEVVAATELHPLTQSAITVPLDFTTDAKVARLKPIARFGDGPWIAGKDIEFPVVTAVATPEQKREFAIPEVKGSIEAKGIRALFGARADELNGRRIFAMHAPAVLTYDIPPGVARLTGFYGLPKEAYAPENSAPSDGAEFIIRHVSSRRGASEVFRRLIEPLRNPDDAGEHAFIVELSPSESGDYLEFEITPGPAGIPASDWTYWADLQLETSP
jgi:4-amino-4-deoxy-L-arabinose transferase-like glycosyltransferase